MRVREVGIQRNERRQARRERDRLLRQTETLEGVDGSVAPPSPSSQTARAEHTRESTSATGVEDGEAGTIQAAVSGTQQVDQPAEASTSSTSRALSTSEVASAEQPQVGVPTNEAVESVTSTVSSVITTNPSRAAAPTAADSSTNVSTTPYTTFQQLEYLPQIPPSVLASSYVIPPTYEAVLSASPNPDSDTGMFRNNQGDYGGMLSPYTASPSATATPYGASPEMSRLATPSGQLSSFNSPSSAHLAPDWMSPTSNRQNGSTPPLLSPVSLLANPSAKNIGPPGLFFVSKGRTSTGIVVSASFRPSL